MKFEVSRLIDAGITHGGVVVSENLAFAWPVKCAGVRLRLGSETVDINRDEAAEVVAYIQMALRDG
jgi:hypothetical protein